MSVYHDGEVAVQQRLGVRAEAERLAPMLAPASLTGGIVGFLAQRTLAAMTARDAEGRLWTSPLVGAAGFLEVLDDTTLLVRGGPPAGDPLHDLPLGQPAGLIVMEYAARRRVRVNGQLVGRRGVDLVVSVDQAFGNCPQYIPQRELHPEAGHQAGADDAQADAIDRLRPEDVDQIARADTFFLGTTHADGGNDSSHRGGSPGFVRVEDDGSLWWPDYPGNNMFTSLGNIAIDPSAALLFVDFATGRTLHLSGTATLVETAPGAPGDDGGTGRRTRFVPERVIIGPALHLHAGAVVPFPRNPPVERSAP